MRNSRLVQDLTGKTLGVYKVLGYDPQKVAYKCRCTRCGAESYHQSGNLKRINGLRCRFCPPQSKAVDCFIVAFPTHARAIRGIRLEDLPSQFTRLEQEQVSDLRLYEGNYEYAVPISLTVPNPANIDHQPTRDTYWVITKYQWEKLFSPEAGTYVLDGELNQLLKHMKDLREAGNETLADMLENMEADEWARIYWTTTPHNDPNKVYLYRNG